MSTIRITGPQPPEGCQWCAVCVMFAKQDLRDQHGDAMEAAAADDSKGISTWHITAGTLDVAVTVALPGDIPGFPPVPVCWTHAACAKVEARSPLDPGNGAVQLPKGFIRGRG